MMSSLLQAYEEKNIEYHPSAFYLLYTNLHPMDFFHVDNSVNTHVVFFMRESCYVCMPFSCTAFPHASSYVLVQKDSKARGQIA